MQTMQKVMIAAILVWVMPLWAGGDLTVSDLWNQALVQYGTGTGAAEYDLSLYFLSQLFGSAGGVLGSGTIPTYVQSILYYFNVGLLLFAGGVISTGITLTVLNTAREGRIMGQQGGAAAFFLRTMGAVALLTPTPALGYISLIQCLVLWVIVQGVHVANFAWNAVNESLNNQGSLFTPITATIADNSLSQETLLNSGIDSGALDLANSVLKAQLCYYSAKRRETQDNTDSESVGGSSNPGDYSTYLLHAPTGTSGDTWQFGGLSYDFSGSSLGDDFTCLGGSGRFTLASDYPSELATDSVTRSGWLSQQYIAFTALFQSMDLLAQTFINNIDADGNDDLSCDDSAILSGSTTSCKGLYDMLSAARTYSLALKTLASTFMTPEGLTDFDDPWSWHDEYYITDTEASIGDGMLTAANTAIQNALNSDELSDYLMAIPSEPLSEVWSYYYQGNTSSMSSSNDTFCQDVTGEEIPGSVCPSGKWFLLGMPTEALSAVLSTDLFEKAMQAWAESLILYGNMESEVQAVVKQHVLAYLSQMEAGAAMSVDTTSLELGGWITAGGLFGRLMPDTSRMANTYDFSYPSLTAAVYSNTILIDGYTDLINYTADLYDAVNAVVSATGTTYNSLQNAAYLYDESNYADMEAHNKLYLDNFYDPNDQTFSVARNTMVYYMRKAMLSLMPNMSVDDLGSEYNTLSGLATKQSKRTASFQDIFNCSGLFGAGAFGYFLGVTDTECGSSTLINSGSGISDTMGVGWKGGEDTTSVLGTVYDWDQTGGLACSEEIEGYDDCIAQSTPGASSDSYGIDVYGVDSDNSFEGTGGSQSAGDVSTQAFIKSDMQVFMFQILKTWIKHIGLNPAPVNPIATLSELGFELIEAGYNYIVYVVQDVWFVNMSLRLNSYMANVQNLLISYVARAAAATASTEVGDRLIKNPDPFSQAAGWITKVGAAAVIGWADGMAAKAQYYEIAYPAKLYASTMYVSIALFAGMPMILLGVMFAFYLPVLPFLVFSFTAIGWFLTVIEAVLAAPLIALGVASPTGHDLLGQSEKVIMLLVSVFARPAAIIIAFIMAVILTYAGFAMVNFLLTNVLANYFMQQLVDADSGFVYVNYMIVFMFIFFYGIILLNLIEQIFSMTYRLPNYLGRWIGTPRDDTGEEAALSSVRGNIQNSIGGLVSSAGGSVEKVSTQQS